jgi:hypothetical protein
MPNEKKVEIHYINEFIILNFIDVGLTVKQSVTA